VIGWRAGCDCGWRGGQFYPRAEWPSDTGAVPAAVEGWEGVTAPAVNGRATSNTLSRSCRSTN